MTLYAFAKYLQSKPGNIYPHLLLAPPPRKSAMLLFEVRDVGTLYSNGTGELTSNATSDVDLERNPTQGVCAATDDEDDDRNPSAVTTVFGWPAESDYPSDYLSSWSSWAGLTPTTTPTATATPTATWAHKHSQ